MKPELLHLLDVLRHAKPVPAGDMVKIRPALVLLAQSGCHGISPEDYLKNRKAVLAQDRARKERLRKDTYAL